MSPGGPTLRDIHPPLAPYWWPPAPGWWLLALIVLVLLILGSLRYWRGRFARKRWREVSDELEALQREHVSTADDAALAAGISQLLRRAAREQVADAVNEHGEAWHRMLERLAPDTQTAQPLKQLDEAMYRAQAGLDAEVTISAARSWLRHVLGRRSAHA